VTVTRSECLTDMVAVDIDLILDGTEYQVTLTPAQDGRGVWVADGDLDGWLSDGNRIIAGLSDDDRHELLSAIEEAARDLAEAKYPCPTSRMTREEWEAEA
jgi:hypothetical protein